ncbi:MAG: hypothetical protein AB7S38_15655 [Vulcanimicrobiota bacterium]
MLTIINRADGSVLGTLSGEEAALLHEVLVDEFEGDADYNIRPATLELLEDKLRPESLAWLRQAADEQGSVEIGLEQEITEPTFEGVLRGTDGAPLGGLRVDILEPIEATAFSRPDGVFQLPMPGPNARFRVTARGNLVLEEFEESTDQPLDIELQIVSGQLVTSDGKGLPLAILSLDSWELLSSAQRPPEQQLSWARTDADGNFRLPVAFPRLNGKARCDFEVFAASGEPLGGYWSVDLELDTQMLLERYEVPDPNPNWPADETETIARLSLPMN